jgi:hypothetical protein
VPKVARFGVVSGTRTSVPSSDPTFRAAVVQGYRELAGITDPAVAIGPAPARQAGMSESFAESVRALELSDEAALIKAMGRGELEARVREYARAEAVAPADVQAEVGSIDEVWKHFDAQARAAAQAGNKELARSAEDICQALENDRERLQVADAARREWAEATAATATATAAEQARSELDQRGPTRSDEAKPEAMAETVREVQADDPAAAIETAQAETSAEIEQGEIQLPETEADADMAADVDAGAWPEAQADMQAGAQAELEAAAAIDKAEADQDADLEI